jgi:hypothetical protein
MRGDVHRLLVALIQDPTLLPSSTRAYEKSMGVVYGNDLDVAPQPCNPQNAQPLLPFSKATT